MGNHPSENRRIGLNVNEIGSWRKETMNKHLLILGIAILLICVGLSGCNEQTGTSSEENKFLGTWTDNTGEITTFYSDGTFTSKLWNVTGTGTWEIKDGKLKTVFIGGILLDYDYSFSNNDETLTLTNVDTGSIYVYTKQEETLTKEDQIEQEKVNFSIEEVIITSELEVKPLFSDEVKLEVSNNSKFIIVSLAIENKEDKWLTVQAFYQSLTDDNGNKYDGNMFVRVNDSTYALEELVLVGEDALSSSNDISPNSTTIKKVVYEIPLDREPDKIRLSYGFKDNELTSVKNWFETELDIQS